MRLKELVGGKTHEELEWESNKRHKVKTTLQKLSNIFGKGGEKKKKNIGTSGSGGYIEMETVTHHE